MTTTAPTVRPLTHTEMTAHIRGRVRFAGIKASVRKIAFCGEKLIDIAPTTYEGQFTAEEQQTIVAILEANHLTGPEGTEFVNHDVYSHGVRGYMGYRA